MTTLKRSLAIAMLAATAMFTSAIAGQHEKTIVGVAAGNKDFSTLVALVKQAGLVDVLNSKGPFTVFAPTNEAFAKLPKETLEAVAGDKELLKKVLLYHVVPGKVLAKDVVGLTEAKTALKQNHMAAKVKIRVEDGMVFINDSKVVATDVKASNGVIHVIDTVLIPSMEAMGAKTAAGSTCSGG